MNVEGGEIIIMWEVLAGTGLAARVVGYSRESSRVKTLRQAATTSNWSSLSLALLTSCTSLTHKWLAHKKSSLVRVCHVGLD